MPPLYAGRARATRQLDPALEGPEDAQAPVAVAPARPREDAHGLRLHTGQDHLDRAAVQPRGGPLGLAAYDDTRIVTLGGELTYTLPKSWAVTLGGWYAPLSLSAWRRSS